MYPRRNPFFIHTKTHQQRLPVVIKIVQTIMSYIHRFIFKSAKLQTKLCLLNINQNKTWTLIFSNVGSEFCLFSCVTLVVYRGYDSWQTTERTHISLSFLVTNKVSRYSVTILFCGMSILHCIKRIWITSVQTEDLLFFNYLNKQQN